MNRITFKVNGVEKSVGSEVSSTTTLLQFLRNKLQLRGTKYMCLEGGCGACMVAVSKCAGDPIQAVNSCLVSVTSCQGWEITTIEKVGNRLEGYHPIQKTLAETHGTQCGYCTPGWIMSMYREILPSWSHRYKVVIPESGETIKFCDLLYFLISEVFASNDCWADIEGKKLILKVKENNE